MLLYANLWHAECNLYLRWYNFSAHLYLILNFTNVNKFSTVPYTITCEHFTLHSYYITEIK